MFQVKCNNCNIVIRILGKWGKVKQRNSRIFLNNLKKKCCGRGGGGAVSVLSFIKGDVFVKIIITSLLLENTGKITCQLKFQAYHTEIYI